MNKAFKLFFPVFIGCFSSTIVVAQINDFGAISSFAVSENFGRNSSLKLEEELRFDQNINSFNRAKTTLGLNYSLFRKLLVAELDYNFLYLKSDNIYECRHRASFGLSTETGIRRFDLGFRTKIQSTWRDELRGDYSYNPKYVWRNKLELDYDIFGAPIKPFVSGEIFCPLNGSKGFYLDGCRTTLGLKYKLSKHNSVEFSLLYDQEVQQSNPNGIIYGVVGWNYKL
ncbi:MAG: DUF2490 domain-containing protein [Paludibacter sp.]|nr:DUF2490 domain-containing protein [Paludibacter sp.]